MEIPKFLNTSSKLNIILIISFSISVNSFILFPNVNNAFYILFHLTLIYLIFYHPNKTFHLSNLVNKNIEGRKIIKEIKKKFKKEFMLNL